MTRYAVWRLRPEDPRSPWRWTFRWDLRWVRPTRKHALALVAGSAFFLVVYWTSAAIRGKPFDTSDLLTVPLIAAACGTLTKRRPDAEAHSALPTLTDSPDAMPALPTLIIVRAEGRVTGREWGWLCAADGWLVFEGLRTTVALKPNSASRVAYEPGGTRLRLTDGREVEFQDAGANGETGLLVTRNRKFSVPTVVRRWHGGFSPEGDATYPPRTMHPEVAGDEACRLLLYATACAIVALVILLIGVGTWAILPDLMGVGFLIAFVMRFLVFRRELPSLVEDALR